MISFDQQEPVAALEKSTDAELDALPFGVVEMDKSGLVTRYNKEESRITGLSVPKVVGRQFFTDVAPCTNNYLVAARFESELALDVTLPYVFTLRMKPTPVTLRLLKDAQRSRMYLLVKRTAP